METEISKTIDFIISSYTSVEERRRFILHLIESVYKDSIANREEYIRLGQNLFNKMNRMFPCIYNDITGTKYDCFYVDDRIDAFLERTKELLFEYYNIPNDVEVRVPSKENITRVLHLRWMYDCLPGQDKHEYDTDIDYIQDKWNDDNIQVTY